MVLGITLLYDDRVATALTEVLAPRSTISNRDISPTFTIPSEHTATSNTYQQDEHGARACRLPSSSSGRDVCIAAQPRHCAPPPPRARQKACTSRQRLSRKALCWTPFTGVVSLACLNFHLPSKFVKRWLRRARRALPASHLSIRRAAEGLPPYVVGIMGGCGTIIHVQ